MTNKSPLDDLATTFICYLPECPDTAYGPFMAYEASDFLTYWNKFFADRNIPGTWISVPLYKNLAPAS